MLQSSILYATCTEQKESFLCTLRTFCSKLSKQVYNMRPVSKMEAKDSSDVKMSNPDRSVQTPDKEFQRRLKAKRCVLCGKEKHGRRDKKDPTPF